MQLASCSIAEAGKMDCLVMLLAIQIQWGERLVEENHLKNGQNGNESILGRQT